MDHIVFRFYGRFVLVKAKNANKLQFLLPNMTFGQSGFREHRPLMSVARQRISLTEGDTTFEPTGRIMTDGDPMKAEFFFWDLTGCNVEADAASGVSLSFQKDTEIVDLAALEDIQGRKARLKATSLRATPGGAVSTTITVEGGIGLASAVGTSRSSAFVRLDEALVAITPGAAKAEIRRAQKTLVDVVDIAVTGNESLRLKFTHDERPERFVTINRVGESTVSFTNLCNAIPPADDPRFELEFAQYYHLLETVSDDRLVPEPERTGGSQGCNDPAMIEHDAG